MASPLSDLDELILKCRDEKAKKYIKEAVSCYKSGAFRSAIVSTWIAVSFDIIDKLKELALTGDKEAKKQLEEFEKALKAGDIAGSLKFERDILEIARDKLELISHVEFIDLARLQEDRNRCAHPSMTSDGDIFTPSAELARVHIRSAVDHLLRYPPAQGKSALEILLKQIDSEYFPTDKSNALVSLKKSPLLKARDSLVRNFIIIILKKLLKGPKDYKETMRCIASLKATEELHKEVYDKTLSEKLSELIKNLEDNDLGKTFTLIRHLEDCWSYLDEDVQLKLKSYVKDLPSSEFDELDMLLDHPGLTAEASFRARFAKYSELENSLFFGLPTQLADRIIEIYSKSKSFDQANKYSTLVTKYSSDFTKEQVEKTVHACGENYEIRNSFEMVSVINALRRNNKVTDDDIDAWLMAADLEEHMKNRPEVDE